MTDETETIAPEPKAKLCQRCNERERGFGQLGRYCAECRDEMKEESETARKARNEATAPKRPAARGNIGQLEREIKDAMMGTAAVAAIANPGIFVAVEATVDEFAAAWANVARTSPAAEKYIRAMLQGGVWITAASATLATVVAVMVCTGNTPPKLMPLGYYIAGKSPQIMEYVVSVQARQPPPSAPDVEEPMAA